MIFYRSAKTSFPYIVPDLMEKTFGLSPLIYLTVIFVSVWTIPGLLYLS